MQANLDPGSQPHNEFLSYSLSTEDHSSASAEPENALSYTETSDICTIGLLPFELVTQVFDYALDTPQPLFMAISLSQVSTQWRAIMLQSPLHWTNVVLDFDIYANEPSGLVHRGCSTEFWEELLARSGDLPLTVTVTGSLVNKKGQKEDSRSLWSTPPQRRFPRNSEAALEAIAVHASRWCDVYLRTTDPNEVYTRLDMMGVNFVNMRFLDMTSENDEDRYPYRRMCPSFLEHSPGLEAAIIPLDIYPMRPSPHQALHVPSLRHLVFEKQQITGFTIITQLMPHLMSLQINEITLSPPAGLHYAFVGFAPTQSLLQKLTINFIPREAEDTLGQQLTFQTLPNLEELYLHCEECPSPQMSLNRILTGLLQTTLTAGPLNPTSVQSAIFVQQLCLFFRRQNDAAMKAQCAGLKTLDLQNVVRSSNSLHELLLSLPPSLTSLDIGEARNEYNDDGLSIFDAESFSLLSGQDGHVLPALKHLWMSVDELSPYMDLALMSMVKTRCKSGCDVELELEQDGLSAERKEFLDVQAELISAEGPGQVVLLW